MRNPNEQDEQRRGRWTPPRWIVHIALSWFIIGSVIGLLLETTTGPWWWVSYHGLAGGDGLGLIVYVNLGAYLITEEFIMVIAHLNNLKDREEAAAKARRELRAAQEVAEEAGRRAGQEEGRREAQETARQEAREAARRETISAVAAARQQLTAAELDNLPAALRDLLNRYSDDPGDNANGSANGTASP